MRAAYRRRLFARRSVRRAMPTQVFSTLRQNLIDTVPDTRARLAEVRKRTLREIEGYRQSLAQIRKAREVTQAEVAGSLGVSQAQVSQIGGRGGAYFSTTQRRLLTLCAELSWRHRSTT